MLRVSSLSLSSARSTFFSTLQYLWYQSINQGGIKCLQRNSGSNTRRTYIHVSLRWAAEACLLSSHDFSLFCSRIFCDRNESSFNPSLQIKTLSLSSDTNFEIRVSHCGTVSKDAHETHFSLIKKLHTFIVERGNNKLRTFP